MNAPRERLVEKALALIVESEVAPEAVVQASQAALNQWRSKSPEHAAALLEARHRWDALGGMADGLRAHFSEPPPRLASSPRNPQRRNLLLSIGGIVCSGLIAAQAAQWYWQSPDFQASYSTRTAQVLKVTLTDTTNGSSGSQLELAPQSAIDVTLYRGRRVIDLERGEVRFDVAHNAERPFQVSTRDALIEVVGTVFTVRDRGDGITIGVEQGHVRVRVQPRDGADTPAMEVIDLHPGELVEVQRGHAKPVRHADARDLSAWRDGWLIFDNTPLGDALASINSYRSQAIVSTDPSVNALRLSGRFRTNDSTGLVSALPAILPVTTKPRADGTVELLAR